MYKLVAIAVSLFIFFMMNISCTPQYRLYKSSSQDIVSSNAEFSEMVKEIQRNFFYNKNDSIYFENIILFPNLANKYYTTFHQLDKESTIKIFGEPHYKDSITLGYVVKKFNFPEYAGRAYERFFVFNNNKLQSISYMPLDRGRDISFEVDKMIKKVYDKNKYLPEIQFIKHNAVSRKIKNADRYCYVAKKNLENEVFFNSQTNCFIINTFIGEPMQNWTDNPCIKNFTIDEINSLFGSPSLVKNDTLFYQLENVPFFQKGTFGTKNNEGKCSFFYFAKILETNSYQLGAIKYEKIE